MSLKDVEDLKDLESYEKKILKRRSEELPETSH